MYKVYGDYLMHCSDDTLAHHGILGMKWGVRRYQNEDGTLTDAGMKRYAGDQADRNSSKEYTQFEKNARKMIHKYFPDANDKEIKFDRIPANFKNRLRPQFVIESIVKSSKGGIPFHLSDWNSDEQIVAIKDGFAGSVSVFVNTKIDGDYVNIAAYSKEGLIKQGLAEKTISRIKDHLTKD